MSPNPRDAEAVTTFPESFVGNISKPRLSKYTQAILKQECSGGNRLVRRGDSIGLGAIVIAIATVPAYAYLDPGTGSIILQAIIGGVAGALFIGRSYVYRLKSWLGASFKAGKGASDQRKND